MNRNIARHYDFGPLDVSESLSSDRFDDLLDDGDYLKIPVKLFVKNFKTVANGPIAAAFNNRYLGCAYQLIDDMADSAAELMTEITGRARACARGCDACCYFMEISASGIELEEIVHYIRTELADDLKEELIGQQTDAPDYKKFQKQPCPFLLRKTGACAIHPVRPISCRITFSMVKCDLENEKDEESEYGTLPCLKALGALMLKLKMMPNTIIKILEARKHHKNVAKIWSLQNAEIEVDFKKLDPAGLIALLRS